MQKISKKFGVIFLIFVFTLSPLSGSNIFKISQAVAAQDITGYQEWNQNVNVDGSFHVSAGATLVIGKGVVVNFINPWSGIYVEGNLIVKGTVKEPVTIKSDLTGKANFYIEAETGSNVSIHNAKIINGGLDAQIIGDSGIVNTAMASSYKGAVQINGGKVDVQNTTFEKNSYAVIVDSLAKAEVSVNRSRFVENGFDVEAETGIANFQYNWWGSVNGPAQTCDPGYGCYYDKIYGDGLDVSKWATQADFHDPVIIIPGILGSWEKDGQMQIDPIFHTYDNLYSEFANNGYVAEKDLFVFPYEWRDSNVENAKKLQTKINEIKQDLNWPKVDLVAHSMGGLLAREYIESDYYGNDVDQLITLATPNLGAPESYMKWEGDGWFLSLSDMYMSHIVKQEAQEGGYADAFDYMHNRPISSLQELLPVYSYLYEVDNGNKLRVYPNNYPRNEFLEKLNNNSSKLNQVEYDKVIGNLNDNKAAVNGINIVSADMGKYWVDGYPLGFEIPRTDRGAIKSNGDGTVPIDSARSVNVKADNSIELATDHQSIVTDAQSDVLEMLTAKRPTTEVRNSLVKNIFIAQAFSPIDLQIVAPDGKRAGKDFVTGEILHEIDGAYYSGYGTQNEFITIPNPIKGEYRILTEGTGNGTYKIETAEIDQNARGVAGENVNTIDGVAVTGQQEEKVVEVTGVEIVDNAVVDTTAPEAKIKFNADTQKLDIAGTDDISQNVSVALADQPVVKKSNSHSAKIKNWFSDWSRRNNNRNFTTTVATLTDEAGNVTNLVFAKTKERKGYVALTLKSIAYNGVESAFGKNTLQYKWQIDRKGQFIQMASHIQSDTIIVESHYLPKKNQTWLMEKPRDLADDTSDDNSEQRPTRTKLAGMIIPTLNTELGKIKINY